MGPAMKDNAYIAGIGCAKPITASRDVATQDATRRLNWQELAERRLTKLTEAEHEATVARHSLDRLQADYCALAQQHREQQRRVVMLTRQSEEQQLHLATLVTQNDYQRRRISELECELAQILDSRSWRWTVPIRWFTTRFRKVKIKLLAPFVPLSS